ncbi:hypothetical protein Tco_0468440 [Tanacetum coccineum]
MSGSETWRALESSKPVVILKFDMHIYTSTLTLEGLNHVIKEFCIPLDLHPLKVCTIEIYTILITTKPGHIDTDVRDDFPISYNEGDVDRIADHVILLRKLPTPLLYMCGLTMDCRHPELSHVIKDAEGKGNDYEKC